MKGEEIIKRIKNETNKFTCAVDLAKKSGKLLALLMCLDFPQRYKKVDLIGFSLGCQVIKSCLAQLKKNKAYKIVRNVYFMGGATWLTIDDLPIFDVLNGEVHH